MRDGVHALGEDVCPHARLVVQQRPFVGVGGWGAHSRAEVDEHALIRTAALDNGGGRIRPQSSRVKDVAVRYHAHGSGPLQDAESEFQGTPGAVVERDQAGSLPGTLEEVGEGLGAIVERPHGARGCGNRHREIITPGARKETEER
jgi:hypothetical protein